MLPPKGSRILIAMSGGVDSAAAAALLCAEGYDCVGVTLRLVPEAEGKSVFEPCCGIEASNDARRVCERLGISHETLHAVDRFDRDIISFFVEEYLAGRTPNPCVRCNRMIKFGALYQRADELGADYIAMGHYARLEPRGGRIALRRAAYGAKDQSYVLAPLTQAQLRRACFPLGGMTKEESRAIARQVDVRSGNKAESQEICFVPDRDYARVIESRLGAMAAASNGNSSRVSTSPTALASPGPILTTRGEHLGEHEGLYRYTLGQRKGLGFAAPAPYYVVHKDATRNALIVGFNEETFRGAVETGPIFWGALAPRDAAFEVLAQIRSHHAAAPATLTPRRGGAQLRFHEPQRAPTPGQWAVFYDADGYVLASAIIRETSA